MNLQEIVTQLHDLAKERRQAAESADANEQNELARLFRAQATTYDDAATVVWAYNRMQDTESP